MASLKNAIRIDFTSSIDGFNQFKQFDKQTIDLIRNNAGKKVVVIADYGHALSQPVPHVVADHLNLSGNNPLVGPNEVGPRFPVINNIYMKPMDTLDPKRTLPLNNPMAALPHGIAAGLRPGIVPDQAGLSTIRSLGGDFYCYNLVPAMLVAAQLGLKVFAIVFPEGKPVDKDTAKYMKGE